MKNILPRFGMICFVTLLACRFASGSEPRQSFVLVSDIDDTLKITDVSDHIDTVYNGLFSSRTFVGMPELYASLMITMQSRKDSLPPQIEPLVLLSGSPTFLKGILQKQFEGKGLPKATYLLKNWFNSQTVGEFKKKRLESLRQAAGLPFLLFGDDTQADPEVLAEFAALHPEATVQVYIHQVLGHAVPGGIIRYFTAFEVAILEFEAGRLGVREVELIGALVLNPENAAQLFPDFAVCPKDYSIPDSPLSDREPELRELKDAVTAYIRKLCSMPRSVTVPEDSG